MKKKIYSGIFMISLALSGAIYAACEDIDELPPQSDTNFINKTYKLPNPTVLTTEEVAEYNAIKAEKCYEEIRALSMYIDEHDIYSCFLFI